MGLAFVQIVGRLVFFNGSWREALGSVVGAAVISGLFFLIYTISKGAWIGFGDVKLAVILGALAGAALPALLVLFTASLIGTIASAPLVLAGKANRKATKPIKNISQNTKLYNPTPCIYCGHNTYDATNRIGRISSTNGLS